MVDKLKEWATQRGYRVAWGSGSIVDIVKQEILQRKSESEIDKLFFNDELKSIVTVERQNQAQTVLLVAKPSSAFLVNFDVDGKSIDALLPPTYFCYRATFEEVRSDLAENGLKGAQVEHLAAPLKALASKLGLVVYGRNNIGYVNGIGSYFQLCGYATDAVLPEMRPVEDSKKSLLGDCENCDICISVCPTGAITEERVLIHAEKCLTYANENAGKWPDWVDSHAHNSLVGCLECQRMCPANPELPIENLGLYFSAAETQLLLSDEQTADDQAETAIRFKLAWLGQQNIESVLGRNLKALLKSKGI